MEICALHVPSRHQGDAFADSLIDICVEVVEHLGGDELGAGLGSLSVAALMSGELLMQGSERAMLWSIDEVRVDRLARWARALGGAGLASILVSDSDALDRPDGLCRQDFGALLGFGVVAASAGVSGRPLVGMPLADLRKELMGSKEALSRAAGYSVYLLCPRPNLWGNAVDGLVLQEARRAGYTLVFEPGSGVAQLDETASSCPTLLSQRWLNAQDKSPELHRWILAQGLARQRAALRRHTHRPKRILASLKAGGLPSKDLKLGDLKS